MAHDIFISCSSHDLAKATQACEALEANGLSCWIAPRNIAPSRPYGEVIIEAINEARLVVLILSARANASQHVAAEVERARNRRLPVLPLRIEDVLPARSLEFFVSAFQFLDAHTGVYEQHLARLAEVAARELGMPTKTHDVQTKTHDVQTNSPDGTGASVIEGFCRDVLAFADGHFERWQNLVRDGTIFAACRSLVGQQAGTAAGEQAAAVIEECFHALGSPGARRSLESFLGHQGARGSTDHILARSRALLASALAARGAPGPWAERTADCLDAPDAAARFWTGHWQVPSSGGPLFRSCLTAAHGDGRVVPMSLNVWSLDAGDVLIDHPEVALHPLRDDLLAAVRSAWEVAGSPGVAWSLQPWRVRLADLPPLGGSSLGLAAAVLMTSLAQGRELDPQWVALGALSGGGVQAVGEEWAKLTEMQRASLVSGGTNQGLAPIHGAVVAAEGSAFQSEQLRLRMATKEHPISVHPVRDIREALGRMTLRPRLLIAQERYEKGGTLIRGDLLERLVRQAADERQHLSFHGPPLCGRRRVAVAVASEVQRRFGWRAALIPLKASHPEPLHAHLLRALTAPSDGGALERLLDALNERQTVLVLDDIEDLLPADGRTEARPIFDQILARAERLVCLFVSRNSITGLPVTTELIGPLATDAAADTVEALLAVDSVRLFVECVGRRSAGFRPGLSGLRQIHDLCRALDGLPGLIKIYAERYPDVSPAEAAAEIRQMRDGDAGDGGHQKTITSALESTYRWLKDTEPDAALIYPRLSAFPHDWSREAARTLCADPTIKPGQVGAALDCLCQLHLVQRIPDPDGGASRYNFRSVICADASGRLTRGPKERLAGRLRQYLVKLAEEHEGQAVGTDSERSDWDRSVGPERRNIEVVIKDVLRRPPGRDGQAVNDAAALALAIWRVYENLGLYHEGQSLLQALIGRTSLPETTRAWLGAGAGWLAYRRGSFGEAEMLLGQARSRFQGAPVEDGEEGLAMVSSDLGVVEMRRGQRDDAIALVDSSLHLYSDLIRKHGPHPRFVRGQAFSNNNLGVCYRLSGSLDPARRHLESARRLFHTMGRDSEAVFAQLELGYLALERGEAAVDQASAAQMDARYFGQKLQEARACTLLGHAVWRQRQNAEEAARYHQEGLHGFLILGASSGMAEALEALACLAWEGQDRTHAGILLGAADGWRAASGEVRPRLGEDSCLAILAQADDPALGDALATGRRMGLKQAAQYVLRHEPGERTA